MFLHRYPYSNIHELNLDWLIKKVKESSSIVETLEKRFEEFLADLPIEELVKERVDEAFSGEDVEFNTVIADNIKGNANDAKYRNIDKMRETEHCGTWYYVYNNSSLGTFPDGTTVGTQYVLIVKEASSTTVRQVLINTNTNSSMNGIYTRYYDRNTETWSDWAKVLDTNADSIINKLNGKDLNVHSLVSAQTKGVMYGSGALGVNIDDYKDDEHCGTFYLVMNSAMTGTMPTTSGQGLLFVKKQAPTGIYRQVYIPTSGSYKGVYTRYYSDGTWKDWTKFSEFSCKTSIASQPDTIQVPTNEWFIDAETTLKDVTPGKYTIMYSARFAANSTGARGISIKKSDDNSPLEIGRASCRERV